VIACPFTATGAIQTYSVQASPLTLQFTGPVDVAGSSLWARAGLSNFNFIAAQPLSFANVSGSASIYSSADVHITGTAQLVGATLGGGGTFYLDGGTPVSPNVISNTLTLNAPLVNRGYTVLNAGVNLGGGVTLTNEAGKTWVMQNQSSVVPENGASAEAFDNEGTLLSIGQSQGSAVLAGGSDNVVNVPLTNGPSGTVRAQAGKLGIFGGGKSSGTFQGDPGTRLSFAVAGFIFNPQSPDNTSAIKADNVEFGDDLAGDGTTQVIACPFTATGAIQTYSVQASPLTLQFTGPVDVTGSSLWAGAGLSDFDFTKAQPVQPLSFANVSGSASIYSSADVHITGTAQLAGATLGGGGTFYLDGGTPVSPNVISNTLTLNAPLVNHGYTVLNAGLNLGGGVTLTNTNAAGATWVMQNGSSVVPENGATAEAFDNEGTLLSVGNTSYSGAQIGGAADDVIAVPFLNGAAATVHVTTGGLGIYGGGSSSGAFVGDTHTRLGFAAGYAFAPQSQSQAPNSAIKAANVLFGNDVGGSPTQVVACPYAVTGTTLLYNVLPGPLTLQFTGTVNLNGGTVNSPVGPSTLDFAGTGGFAVRIGGYTAGSQYDQFNVIGDITLAGSLQLSLINGFTPHTGDQFTIIANQGTYPVRGTFAGLPEGATFIASGYQFQISYAGGTDHQDVTLTVTQVATTTSLASSVDPSDLGQSVTFTATVAAVPAGAAAPTGSVQFQVDGTNFGAPAALVNGQASFSTASLAAGTHTITAVYSGDGNFLGSSGQMAQAVHYQFGGFLSPLNPGGTYHLGRTLAIQFQLTDYYGNAITSLSAVTSLQVQSVDALGHPLAPPFNPAPAGGSGLRYDPTANQFIFNWSTQGLTAGYYEIELTLADGTLQTLTLQLS
jgi:hypothetical protein